MNNISNNNSGWKCPVCERVYAPLIVQCTVCNNRVSDCETEKSIENDFKNNVIGTGTGALLQENN